MHPFHKMWSL